MLTQIAQKNKLSLGLVFPIEAYKGSIAKMENQEALAKRAEELGFTALWFRDVPFNDPTFGDAGQLYDPWVYMAHIMNHTEKIALATGSIILPLRHPVHTVKSFSSLQVLSKGRIILGLASGDRPNEYPAFNRNLNKRTELFRESFAYIRALQESFPRFESSNFGTLNGNIDLLPKYHSHTPMFVTGHSGQTLDWIAKNSDAWLYYPRDFAFLQQMLNSWKDALERNQQDWKPYMQSLYIDLEKDRTAMPKAIHLGFKSGRDYLLAHLKTLENFGVSHVIVNLKYASIPAKEILEELGEYILPEFS